ncbi:MAG: major capsid protein [Microvirus sp.]|nr:MAG: major capsid protein [Microvirus sp.]
MKFFDSILKNAPKRSKFDMSQEKKLSFNQGELIPILCQDILPGDTFRVHTELLIRLAPMIAPPYTRMAVTVQYYFVPWRLVWNESEHFITGGEEGSVQPIHPYFRGPITDRPDLFGTGSLCDYMGIPVFDVPVAAPGQQQNFSALPFRAYQTIYNEYFRDQDLTPAVPTTKLSGEIDNLELIDILKLRKKSWEKDRFTSARPWAQKGEPVTLPVGYAQRSNVINENGIPATAGPLVSNATGNLDAGTPAVGSRIENLDVGTINDLRKAHALQRFLEKLARGGSRYAEYLKNIWGTRSADSRLQRPEYLGGFRQPVVISEVLSTYDNTAGNLPQGTMSGHGISVGGNHGFNHTFTEHGYVIGVMHVIPRTSYMQGIPRHFQRFTRLDHAIPDFANLGEQEIKNKEVYIDFSDTTPPVDPEGVFGYEERYGEYKFNQNSSHGDFRGDLAFWTQDRIFPSAPQLNANFVEADPTNRIFAVQDPDIHHLWAQMYNRIDAIRPLPYHADPR